MLEILADVANERCWRSVEGEGRGQRCVYVCGCGGRGVRGAGAAEVHNEPADENRRLRAMSNGAGDYEGSWVRTM